jgi:hypothetical protein
VNQIMKRETGTSVAASGSGNPFAAYGEAATQNKIVGTLLKFNKGEYLAGKDAEVVPEGTRLVANMDQLLVGWIKWENGAPSEQVMGRVADVFKPPLRNELGDNDKSLWEVDDQGVARDPWQLSNYLVLKGEESDELYTFTTSSRGGLNAIGELCKAYGKEMRQQPDQYPVVSLEVDSYRHSNKAYGKIHVPVLTIVDWIGKEVFEGLGPAGGSEESGDQVDDLPLEAEPPKAQTPVAQTRAAAPAPQSRGKPTGGQSTRPAAAAAGTRF